jgi:Xaa-Pro aminopeptidase
MVSLMSAQANTAPAKTPAEKLAALRAQFAAKGISGYLIPHDDEYKCEYLPANAERLAWLTGFTGSAGAAAVLEDKALALTDGRYTIQIRQQVDGGLYEIGDSGKTGPGDWLAASAAPGSVIGYDPRLHSPGAIAALEAKLKDKNITLAAIDGNLIDAIWDDRPAAPAATVEAFPDAIAGRTATEKRELIADGVRRENAQAVLLTAADSIAWLLNIRGHDVPHNPFALSYAIVHENGDVDWFIPGAKVPQQVRAGLGNHVSCREPADLEPGLAALAAKAKAAGKPVLMDYSSASVWFKNRIESAGAQTRDAADPCIAPRAVKTAAEQKSLIDAHIRDGVAMVRFLKWIEDTAPAGGLTELEIEDRLLDFRRQDPGLRDTSFTSIVGWAGNGAIVHYHATKESNATVKPPGILLVDSGGQYLEGTTDITRTVAVGKPSEEMKENFTRVLKGHIGVAALRFPEGLTGDQVDPLARKPLWEAGRDFAHGTGHGVGCYLGVHEPGIGISPRARQVFRPGMLVSNEPGYYKEGAYGIRIENLILVREDGQLEDGGRRLLRFETVSLAPIDRALIKPEMLEEAELAWLNAYHARVYKTLAPLLDADTANWLKTACAPLKKNLSPAPAPKPPAP